METLEEVLDWINLVALVLLGVLTFRRWRAERDAGSRWVLLTFGTLALVAVFGRILPDNTRDAGLEMAFKLLIAVLLLFPFFLYRTGTSFKPAPRWVDAGAVLLTAGMIVWTFLVPHVPAPGEERPAGYSAFILGVVIQWTVLSVIVTVRFWRAGRGQPGVVQNRMRSFAIAAAMLSLVIVLAGASGNEAEAQPLDIVTGLLTLCSVALFFVSFNPPSWLRTAWRRRETEAIRSVMIDLMSCESREQVFDTLLPQAARLVAAEGIALYDADGRHVAAHGEVTEMESDQGEARLHTFPYPFGTLVVRTTPYTPFFGTEEVEIVGAMGALASLSLRRIEAEEMRVQLETAAIRRHQALEINDNVVQGLAVAKYAFEMNDLDKARSALEGTLAAARKIIGDLVEEIGVEEVFDRSSGIRNEAATGFSMQPPPGG